MAAKLWCVGDWDKVERVLILQFEGSKHIRPAWGERHEEVFAIGGLPSGLACIF
jgi:hypothetical protein